MICHNYLTFIILRGVNVDCPIKRTLLTQRNCFLMSWIIVLASIMIALYMQYFMALEPCALCMTQRVFFFIVGLVALGAWIQKPREKLARIYASSVIMLAALGSAFSIRHLWLQSLPPEQAPACGPSLSYLFDAFPFMEAMAILLKGDGNCAESLWSLFGITIPGWALIVFIVIIVINLGALFIGNSNSIDDSDHPLGQ